MDGELAARHIISQLVINSGPAIHGMVSTASGVVSRILFRALLQLFIRWATVAGFAGQCSCHFKSHERPW